MTLTTPLASPSARLNQARVVVWLDGRRPVPAHATNPRVSIPAARVGPADPALTRPTSHKQPHAAASSTIQSP
jgi:hypothetical protein